MSLRPLRNRQGGYLIEVPILIAAALIILVVVFPSLPPTGKKVLVVAVAIPVLYGLYYMTVTPGWMPGDRRIRSPLNWLVFLFIAAVIVVGVMGFVLK